MKFFKWCKDGGSESTVSGEFFIEIKSLFSIVLLRFEPGSRNAYHSHAFDSTSWVLKGRLEERYIGGESRTHLPSWRPVKTYRETFHQVVSHGTTWVLSFRGPWAKSWNEYLPASDQYVTLTDGRKEI